MESNAVSADVPMLVCHCNVISDREIEEVVLAFLGADPWQLIVPAKVYRELGRRGRCCGCFPNVVDIITKVTENYHVQNARNSAELIDVRARLDAMRREREGEGNERRGAGYRAA